MTSTTATPAFSTCDFCDTFKNDSSGAFRVLPPVWRDFGGIRAFSGPISTVQCFEHLFRALAKPQVHPLLGEVAAKRH